MKKENKNGLVVLFDFVFWIQFIFIYVVSVINK